MEQNSLFERALILFRTHRYKEAEEMLLQGLSQNPEDAYALTLLAISRLNQDKYKEAMEPAERAVALEPDQPFMLTTLGRTLFFNNKPVEARSHLNGALQMDPSFTDAYAVLSQIEFHEKNWEMALYNAERGLEHDPEEQTLLNLRSMALVQLGRNEEAAQTVDYALHNDPEDAYAHSNKGWTELHRGNYDDAVAAFKQALRFDPNNDSARNGLKEAIKGKNWIYRGILRYFLFMGKLSEGNQWVVVIGLYLGMRFLRYLSVADPSLKPLIAPISFAYMIFVFGTWIGRPLSDLFLRLHPVGKYALTNEEKRNSNIVGAFFFAGLAVMALSWFTPEETARFNWSILGMTLFAMLIPIGGFTQMGYERNTKWVLLAYAGLMLLAGPLNMLFAIFVQLTPITNTLLSVFAFGIFLYGWVANALVSWASK